MCSHGTSCPSALQTRFCWMRAPSLSWSMWKRTSLGEVAEKSFTGTLTRPKEIDPLQIGRATSGDLARRGEVVVEQRRMLRPVLDPVGVDPEVAEEPQLVLPQAFQVDRLLGDRQQRVRQHRDPVVDELRTL